TAAAADARQAKGIGLRATATNGKPPRDVTVDIKIDAAKLGFTQKEEGANVDEVDVAVFCADSRDEIVGTVWQTLQLSYTDERLEAVKRDRIPLTVKVPLTRR